MDRQRALEILDGMPICYECDGTVPWSCDECGDAILMAGKALKQPEIVRCKDCKYLIDHYGFMDDGYCKNMRETYYLKFKPEDDWFCADGKRKET